MHARKMTKIMDHALEVKIPLIGINDSGGAGFRKVLIHWQDMVKYFSGTLSLQV